MSTHCDGVDRFDTLWLTERELHQLFIGLESFAKNDKFVVRRHDDGRSSVSILDGTPRNHVLSNVQTLVARTKISGCATDGKR